MKVILNKDVKDLGKRGQVVEVSEGYARNFLLPRGLVSIATEGAARGLEQEKTAQLRKKEREQKEAQSLVSRLNAATVKITAKAGEHGRLFGAVTAHDIANQLASQGLQVDKRRLEVPSPIKVAGTYKVTVRVHPETTATLTVHVVPE
ncbi:MAG: 50S ribosomal protein L9 [Peptococcaceae bacterium]|nr:50S ribosomal protein L9 [Peptococcaceae bacterium]